MKKIRYSVGVKAIILALQEILSVLLVICVILVSRLFDSSMLDLQDLQNRSFWSSGYYNGLFERTLKELLSYQIFRYQFETDGSYNPKKAVNVSAYMNTHTGSRGYGTMAGREQFRYYLENLEDWSRDYAQTTYQVESRLYTAADGTLYQKQVLYQSGKTVQESENQVENLEELERALLQMIVSEAEYYYGGNYNLNEYGSSSSGSIGMKVYTEVAGEEILTETAELTDLDADTAAASEGQMEGSQIGESGQSSENQPSEEGQQPENQSSESGQSSENQSSEEGQQPESQTSEEGQQPESGAEPQEEVKLETVIQKIRDGKLFQLNLQELKLVLEDLGLLDQTTVTEFSGIQEDYLTVDGTSILGECLSGTITLDEMQQAYEGLAYTLDAIGDEINAYRKLANRYGQEETNLKFWIYNEIQNQYYTNLTGQERGGELLAYGKELGSYFYYNKAEVRLDTNVNGLEEAFYDKLDTYNSTGNQVIFIGVDTTLPYGDMWKSAEQEYQRLQPWAMASLVMVAVSSCGLFLSFVYIGLAAGHRSEGNEIHLTWFEKIKTEFLLLAFGLLGIGIVMVVSRLIYMSETSDTIGVMIMGGGLVFSIVAVFDILYMSLVRRIKAGIMWTESLMHWFGDSIHKILDNRRPSLRILLGFSVHTILLFLLGMLLVESIYRGNNGLRFCILIAFFLLTCWELRRFLREGIQRNALIGGIRQIAAGDLEYKIDTKPLKGDNKIMGEAINTIGEGLFHAVDDSVKNERLKADLITNVSHDIKTPLTSIINYVDLLRRENLENERARNYIQILDAKSQRLKQLTEDLVEVSRISSGNITLQMDRLNLVELVYQSAGEFAERFEERNLTVVTKLPGEPVIILADGRRIWRVLENLYNNVAKYAMENTRVYVDMEVVNREAVFSIKNISRQALNIDASELTERFIRGDVSRSTEGSGLGLSIAQNLATLMGGDFRIYLDGDLFKVTVAFPVVKENEKSGP